MADLSPTGIYPTYHIRRSWAAAHPTGATALVLDTVESGPIAFLVPLEAIAILRQQLTELQMLLSLGTGSA